MQADEDPQSATTMRGPHERARRSSRQAIGARAPQAGRRLERDRVGALVRLLPEAHGLPVELLPEFTKHPTPRLLPDVHRDPDGVASRVDPKRRVMEAREEQRRAIVARAADELLADGEQHRLEGTQKERSPEPIACPAVNVDEGAENRRPLGTDDLLFPFPPRLGFGQDGVDRRIRSERRVLEPSGRVPRLEKPELFRQRIEEFIQEHPAPSRWEN